MTYASQFANDPAGRLAAEVAQVRAQAKAGARRAAFIFPILDDDPPVDDPTNMWGFDDGRIRWRGTDGEVHEVLDIDDMPYRIESLSSNPGASTGIDYFRHDSSDEFRIRRPDGTWARYASISASSGGTGGGNQKGDGSSSKTKTTEKSPKTFRETWAPTWAQTLCPVHGPEGGGELTYGRWNATHGQRRIMIGFNASSISNTLSGAKVKKVELHMLNTHAFLNSGITVKWGAHNQANPPGGYSAVRRDVFRDHWPKVGEGAYWRGGKGDITWFGRAFRDGQIKGLVIDQLSDSRSFYGKMIWSSIRFRVTYTTTNY